MLDISKGQFFKSHYRDFEGLANAKRVLELCKTPPTIPYNQGRNKWAWDAVCMDEDSPELRVAVRSIGLNLIYETVDMGGIENVRDEDILTIFYMVREMLTVPKWSEVSVDQIEFIMNLPDEE